MKADRITSNRNDIKGMTFIKCIGHCDYYRDAMGKIVAYMWSDYCG